MEKSRGYYASWNNPGTGRQVSGDLIYVWNLVDKLIHVESRTTVTKGWGRGKEGKNGGVWSKGTVSDKTKELGFEICCTAQWL
jgi:hypothetical protein